MSAPGYTILARRGVLAATGDDAVQFLQGIVTADVRMVSAERAVYGALLTPQGKFLHDFFVLRHGETLLVDCDGERTDDLLRRMSLYRLRAKVELTNVSDRWTVAAVFGDGAAAACGLPAERGAAATFAGGVVYVDPRLAAAGARAVVPNIDSLTAAGMSPIPVDAYEALRISLGLPDGARDIVVDGDFLLEAGFDELAGVDWNKGCFLGQEVTARIKYRGLVKKRLVPVMIDGPLPATGTPITRDGRTIGEMRSTSGNIGLALLRLDALAPTGEYEAGEGHVTPCPPNWMNLG